MYFAFLFFAAECNRYRKIKEVDDYQDNGEKGIVCVGISENRVVRRKRYENKRDERVGVSGNPCAATAMATNPGIAHVCRTYERGWKMEETRSLTLETTAQSGHSHFIHERAIYFRAHIQCLLPISFSPALSFSPH